MAITKGQCTIPGRYITWICIKTPRSIKANTLLEITSDRQLPKGLIPLDILHNIQHKQLQEMLIPILNTSTYIVKLPKNTVLGSITEVDATNTIYSISSLHQHNGKAPDENEYPKPLLPSPIVPVSQHMHMTTVNHYPAARHRCSPRNTTTVTLHANQQIFQHHFQVSSRCQAYQPHGNGSTHHRTTSIIKAIYYPLKVPILCR